MLFINNSRNTIHTSRSDLRPHVTVKLATEEQESANKHQTVHIYHNKEYQYLGHLLLPERDNIVKIKRKSRQKPPAEASGGDISNDSHLT